MIGTRIAGSSAVCASSLGMKKYGVVQINNKKYLRNYRRELKNGKGMDIKEAMVWWGVNMPNEAFQPLCDT